MKFTPQKLEGYRMVKIS